MSSYQENTCWKTLLTKALERNGESWSHVVANTMNIEDMGREFDAGFGALEGCPFTVWTAESVYFPVNYDGAEWVSRVARNPDGKPTRHKGS